jgi:hypothetical protein
VQECNKRNARALALALAKISSAFGADKGQHGYAEHTKTPSGKSITTTCPRFYKQKINPGFRVGRIKPTGLSAARCPYQLEAQGRQVVKEIPERYHGLTLVELLTVEQGQTRLLAERAARGIDQGEQSICNLETLRRRMRELERR